MSGPNPHGIAAVVANVDAAGEVTEALVGMRTPEWRGLMNWLLSIDVDPRRVPAGSRIVRNEAEGTVTYDRVLVDDQGRPRMHGGRLVSEQTTFPPARLPALPPLLAQWLRPTLR